MVAGMPSTISRTPRMPKVERAPKPRIDSCRSWAWFWRSSTTRPGTRAIDSARLRPGPEARSVAPSTAWIEAGASKARCSVREAETTTSSSAASAAWVTVGVAHRDSSARNGEKRELEAGVIDAG